MAEPGRPNSYQNLAAPRRGEIEVDNLERARRRVGGEGDFVEDAALTSMGPYLKARMGRDASNADAVLSCPRMLASRVRGARAPACREVQADVRRIEATSEPRLPP